MTGNPSKPKEHPLHRYIAHTGKQRVRLVRLGRAGLVAAALAICAPTAAQAAPYDNTDPAQTGCAANAYTVTSRLITDSRGGRLALLELRWSTTCRTNWTRMTSYQGARLMRGYIDRPSTGSSLTFGGTFSSIYTNQLYGGNSCLYSFGWVKDPYTGNLNMAQTACY